MPASAAAGGRISMRPADSWRIRSSGDLLHLPTMDSSLLLQDIARHIALTSDGSAHFTGLLHHRALTKKQFLSQHGELTKSAAFAICGLLRRYPISTKGFEPVIKSA